MSYETQRRINELITHYFNNGVDLGSIIDSLKQESSGTAIENTIVYNMAQHYNNESFYDQSIQLIHELQDEPKFSQLKNIFILEMLNNHHIDIIYQMTKDGLLDSHSLSPIISKDPNLVTSKPSLFVGIFALIDPIQFPSTLIRALRENPALIECINFDHEKYLELLKSNSYSKDIRPDMNAAILSDSISDFQEALDRIENPNMLFFMDAAASQGAVNIFKFILMNGTDPENSTAISAIKGGSLDIIRTILDKGIDFFNADAAVSAIQYHRTSIMEWIDSNDPNIIQESSYKLLTASIQFCNNESFDMIISRLTEFPILKIEDFDVVSFPFLVKYLSVLSIDQRTEFLSGKIKDKSELFDLLVSSPEVHFDACKLIYYLLRNKWYDRVKAILKRDDLDITSFGTYNPLQFALQNNCDTCGLENDKRFGSYSRSEYQKRCVEAMLKLDNLTFKSLLKYTDTVDENGDTLLHVIARELTEKKLESFGIKVSKNGIQLEEGQRLSEIFKLLAKHCDKDARNRAGQTAGEIIQSRHGDYVTQVLAGFYRMSVDKDFPALTNGECTYKRFKKKFVIQSRFLCSECDLDHDTDSAVCEICASRCHHFNGPNKHQGIVFDGVELLYCDCPSSKDPKCHVP